MADRSKTPYAAAVAIQATYTGLFVVSKAAFDSGVNTYAFIFYRLAAATALLLPIALIDCTCRRSRSTTAAPPAPAMSCRLLFKLFLYALLGNTFTLNVYNMSLKRTSATVGSAATNSVPVATFLLVLLLRMESVKLRSQTGLAKLAGITLCLAGVLVIAFYAGLSIRPLARNPVFAHQPHGLSSGSEWIKGTFLLIVTCATLSLWIVLQVPLLKELDDAPRVAAENCLWIFGVTSIS